MYQREIFTLLKSEKNIVSVNMQLVLTISTTLWHYSLQWYPIFFETCLCSVGFSSFLLEIHSITFSLLYFFSVIVNEITYNQILSSDGFLVFFLNMFKTNLFCFCFPTNVINAYTFQVSCKHTIIWGFLQFLLSFVLENIISDDIGFFPLNLLKHCHQFSKLT